MISKRCPNCNKQVFVNPDRKIMKCGNCGIKIYVSKSLGHNAHNGNAHGVKLWVERSWSYGGKK